VTLIRSFFFSSQNSNGNELTKINRHLYIKIISLFFIRQKSNKKYHGLINTTSRRNIRNAQKKKKKEKKRKKEKKTREKKKISKK